MPERRCSAKPVAPRPTRVARKKPLPDTNRAGKSAESLARRVPASWIASAFAQATFDAVAVVLSRRGRKNGLMTPAMSLALSRLYVRIRLGRFRLKNNLSSKAAACRSFGRRMQTYDELFTHC